MTLVLAIALTNRAGLLLVGDGRVSNEHGTMCERSQKVFDKRRFGVATYGGNHAPMPETMLDFVPHGTMRGSCDALDAVFSRYENKSMGMLAVGFERGVPYVARVTVGRGVDEQEVGPMAWIWSHNEDAIQLARPQPSTFQEAVGLANDLVTQAMADEARSGGVPTIGGRVHGHRVLPEAIEPVEGLTDRSESCSMAFRTGSTLVAIQHFPCFKRAKAYVGTRSERDAAAPK